MHQDPPLVEATSANSGTPSTGQPFRLSNLLLWAAVLFILAILGWGLLNSNAPRPEAGQPAPDFPMEFFSGYEWEGRPAASLSDLRGKVVVLNFWASWCVECRLESDLLEATWRKYRDQDVVFLGIAWADTEPKSRAYMQEFGITFPNAPDLGRIASLDYEVTGAPETFFIDQSGQIARTWVGPIDQQMLEGTIQSLLEAESEDE
jgi:cytochrome c biogenesis protein CcmG/thiol:disulfide interchange protein DsbE